MTYKLRARSLYQKNQSAAGLQQKKDAKTGSNEKGALGKRAQKSWKGDGYD